MTSLPPPGWYPDPQAGGATWRWWDGFAWAPPAWWGYDPAAAAQLPFRQAESTRRAGQWLRWGLVASAASQFLILTVAAFVAHGGGFHFASTSADGTVHFSSGMVALELVSFPLNLLALGFIAVFIAWIYNAGKFAETQRWPAARGRTLGAFSLFIPIVNFWWPYEAVRDAFPSGSSPPRLLQWWLSYLLVPFVAWLLVLAVSFTGPVVLICAVLAVDAFVLTIPARLGWGVINDMDAIQRAHLPRTS